jgi:hypothetical protein
MDPPLRGLLDRFAVTCEALGLPLLVAFSRPSLVGPADVAAARALRARGLPRVRARGARGARRARARSRARRQAHARDRAFGRGQEHAAERTRALARPQDRRSERAHRARAAYDDRRDARAHRRGSAADRGHRHAWRARVRTPADRRGRAGPPVPRVARPRPVPLRRLRASRGTGLRAQGGGRRRRDRRRALRVLREAAGRAQNTPRRGSRAEQTRR